MELLFFRISGEHCELNACNKSQTQARSVASLGLVPFTVHVQHHSSYAKWGYCSAINTVDMNTCMNLFWAQEYLMIIVLFQMNSKLALQFYS